MATKKSAQITNLDASPSVIPNVTAAHGRVMTRFATDEVAAADNDGDVFRMLRVNAQDRILRITILCDAITSGTDYDLGVYAINDGDAVDADCYVTTVDLSSALTTTNLNYRWETQDVANAGYRVWQDAGVSADPGNVQYDLAFTANTVGSAAGTITLIIEYVAGS